MTQTDRSRFTLTRRSALASAAAAGIAAGVGGLLPSASAAAARQLPAAQSAETTLVVAIDSDPANLEPGTNLATPTGSEIIVNIFDTLVTWKAPEFSEIEGRLAESWTVSDDGSV